MLIRGEIPKKEPIIRVGIILPQDNIKETSITLSDAESYEMETDKNHFPSCKNHKEISIIVKKNKMVYQESTRTQQQFSPQEMSNAYMLAKALNKPDPFDTKLGVRMKQVTSVDAFLNDLVFQKQCHAIPVPVFLATI